jgi:hypothetical protein
MERTPLLAYMFIVTNGDDEFDVVMHARDPADAWTALATWFQAQPIAYDGARIEAVRPV